MLFAFSVKQRSFSFAQVKETIGCLIHQLMMFLLVQRLVNFDVERQLHAAIV